MNTSSRLAFGYSDCGEPILMDQSSVGFSIYFCVLARHHDGPCKDEKGRWFKRADRVEAPKTRRRKTRPAT
ncbi:MAG TPA: hypothetical protein VHV32_19005 [Candidatus Angelobacter sp.]|jgi:hypothetical protein|nr:hypothetical protein [Candidatus Angelobacter sp.]